MVDRKVYVLVSACLIISLISVGFAGFTYYNRTSQSKATGTSVNEPIPPDLDKTYWDNWRGADSVADYQQILNQASRYEHNPSSWHSPPSVSIGQGFGVGPYDYVVFQGDKDNYYARSGDNGQIMYEGADASTVVQNAVDSLSRGTVYLRGFGRPSGVTTTENVSILTKKNGNLALENGSFSTEQALIENELDVPTKIINSDGKIYPYSAGNIQQAIDDLPIVNNRSGKVWLPFGDLNTTFDVDNATVNLEGSGIGTYIYGSGDHTVDIAGQDVKIEDVWIDQTGTGSYNAINATGGEVEIASIDIDDSPQYGIYVGGNIGWIHDLRIRNCGEQIRVDADSIEMNNINFCQPDNVGVLFLGDKNTLTNFVVEGGASDRAIHIGTAATNNNVSSGQIQGVNNIGIEVDGDRNRISDIMIDRPTSYGIRPDGDGNVFSDITINDPGDAAISGTGDNNIFTNVRVSSGSIQMGGENNVFRNVVVDGDLTFASGSSRCAFYGKVGGTITDDGTMNIVNGKVTSPENINMGGTDGTISPTPLPVDTIPVYVDAGGANVNLNSIDGPRRDGQKVRIIHTGGENITINHDGSISPKMLLASGSNETLTTNGWTIEFVWDAQNNLWRETWRNFQTPT